MYEIMKKYMEEVVNNSNPIEEDEIIEVESDLYEYDGQYYRIMESEEYDRCVYDLIDDYIDDCVLPKIPEIYRGYFDSEAYIRYIYLSGEQDLFINSYDGYVDEYKYRGQFFRIWIE